MRKVCLVSLGCPKNRVDSEVMLGHLVGDGYEPVQRPEEADVVVVNTCGFIDAAKEESVDTVVELAEQKSEGVFSTLVVTGCLSQRYASELAYEIPEVDHFLGTGNFESIAEVLRQGRPAAPQSSHELPVVGGRGVGSPPAQRPAPSTASVASSGTHDRAPQRPAKTARPERGAVVMPDPDFNLTAESPRIPSGPLHSTYVKVSDGCSNRCAFCIIPVLRGPQRSRPPADVAAEVDGLLRRGTVEINLIAQDLCAYGSDLTPRRSLAQLLRALDEVADTVAQSEGRPVWLRCLYAYPRGLTRQALGVMARARHIVPYLDIPLQHISDRLLRRMRRGKAGTATRALVRRMRETIPGLHLRTTFITGMPGESEDDFAELCDFVQEVRFEHMGVFAFSPEEGTAAASMSGQVDPQVAADRCQRLMAIQRKISQQQQRALVGRELLVLVEGVSEETDLLLQGRHPGQAPEIDGVTYINEGVAAPGELVRVQVQDAGDYDLVGGIVEHVSG